MASSASAFSYSEKRIFECSMHTSSFHVIILASQFLHSFHVNDKNVDEDDVNKKSTGNDWIWQCKLLIDFSYFILKTSSHSAVIYLFTAPDTLYIHSIEHGEWEWWIGMWDDNKMTKMWKERIGTSSKLLRSIAFHTDIHV